MDQTPDQTITTPTAQPITFNAEAFAHYLDEFELSDHEVAEFLECYWALLVQVADFGFGTHPFQLASGDKASVLDILLLSMAEAHEEDTDNHD